MGTGASDVCFDGASESEMQADVLGVPVSRPVVAETTDTIWSP